MERSGRTSTLLAVKRSLYDTLLARDARRNSAETMKTSVRGSKSPSKVDSSKLSTMPTSSDFGRGSSVPLSYLNYRDNGRYVSHSGRGNNVNFLQKNRQACSRTGNPAAGLSPLRSKLGQAPQIGDALGTPSNKGSSCFMTAGHNGIRDPEFKAGFKKREHNF